MILNKIVNYFHRKYRKLEDKTADFFSLPPILIGKKRPIKQVRPLKVLVLGVALFDRRNHYSHISKNLSSKLHDVNQLWVILKSNKLVRHRNKVENIYVDEFTERSKLINKLCIGRKIHEYDYVIIVDDDIRLERNFIDKFLSAQEYCDFSLAQPARTEKSVISHEITIRHKDLLARETNFVEIGPLVSIRNDALAKIIPLDETFPMGWGLDYVWSQMLMPENKKIGIIDAFPVAHTLRHTGSSYDYDKVDREMKELLAKRFPNVNYNKYTFKEFK